jgi:hypothetical protein
VATLSLAGIAGASAADVGNAQTYTGNHHTVQKDIKKQYKDFKSLNKSTTTQNTVDKDIKMVNRTSNNEQVTFENQRFSMSAKHSFATAKIENFRMLQIKDLQTTLNKNSVKHVTNDTVKKVPSKYSVKQATNGTVKKVQSKKQVNDNTVKVSIKNSVKQVTNDTVNVPSKDSVKQATTDTIKKVSSKDPKKQGTTEKYKKYAYKKWYKENGKWKYKWAYSYKEYNTSDSKYPYAAAGSTKTVKKSTTANTSSVKALASSLTKGVSSQYQKGTKIFNWVRDHISYSFYYNTKYGASGTLKYRKGNCADQAHLVVALARSAGLQARYVHVKAKFTSGHVYGHVYAQIKANGKWYTADPTSSRNSFGVARNWTSATIKGIYNTLPF